MLTEKKETMGALLVCLAATLWGFDSIVLTPNLFKLIVPYVVFMVHLLPFVGMTLLFGKEELKNIEDKINKLLSELEQEVLGLYLNGKSYQEIADIIGKEPKSIDNALQRVKRKLEKHLENVND